MKHVVFLGDGMADEPFAPLGGHTPLELANHPGMDFLATAGEFGLTRTVPHGMPAGSDTANLSVFGYDPKIYYSGRSPLEAASMGIPLAQEDVTYRCNLVTLSDAESIEDTVMVDYSSDDISNEEAHELIAAIAPIFEKAGCELHPGVHYRHCLVLRNAPDGAQLTPPHDISGKPVREYLPKGEHSELFLQLMNAAREVLLSHPVNQKRIAAGLHPANSVWFWGEGRRPALTSFREKFGVERGGVISAVDLVQGIGVCAGLEVIPVANITGNYHTDFAAKGRAAVKALTQDGFDFVYIHVEAPDECGHHGEAKEKIWSIEQIDEKIILPVLEALRKSGEPFSALVMPDHPTPLAKLTHTPTPVPYALYRSDAEVKGPKQTFTEANAEKTGIFTTEACTLMPRLLQE